MAILFVQSNQALTTTGTISATYYRTPTPGNLLVAFYVSNSSQTTTTITGWNALTNTTTNSNQRSQRMFWKIAGASESTTVNVTSSNGTSHLTLLEYSGVDQINPLLAENNVLGTAADVTYSTPTVTPTAGMEALVVAAVTQKNNDTPLFTAQQINGSAAGVNIRSNANAAMKSPATVFDRFITSTSGTYAGSATRTITPTVVGGGAIAVFKAAPIPGKSLAYESWDGTNGAAWPSQWSQTPNATAGTSSIQSNQGQLTTTTGAYATAGQKLTSVSSVNQRLLLDFSMITNTEHYLYVGMRSSGSFGSGGAFGTEYYFNLFLPATSLEIGRHQGTTTETTLSNIAISGGGPTATIHLDASIIGSQLTVYVWSGTNAKPSTPSYTVTNTAITAAGTVMLYQANGASGTANVTFDNLYLTTGLAVSNTAAPAISGTVSPSSVLTVSNGSWSATPDSYLYQWYRDGIAISGATASTYTYTDNDVGTALSAYVQAVKAEYATGGAFSNSVAYAAPALTNTAPPTITGTTTPGSVLTATNGTWSATPDNYTYQWNRSGAAISGATSQTYTIVSADVGVPVTVTVTAIKATYTNGAATSSSVTPTGTSFANSAVPVISGTQATGQTLSVSNGTWTQIPDSYAYQWNRDGAAIAGATSQTYVLQTYDQGLPVTAVVTATKSGTGIAATAAAVTPAAAAVGDKMTVWKAALANRATAPATFVAMGSLTTEGQGASNRATRWIARMRDALRRNYRTSGVTGGEGYIPAGFATGGPWADWYTSKTGTVTFLIWAANIGYRLMSLSASSSITYTFVGTDIDIAYSSGDTAFSYSIDGGAAVAVANDPTYASDKIRSVTGLTAGTHTITISTNSSQTAVINGFFIYNGDRNKGIHMIDAGHSYFATSGYTGDLSNYVKALRTAAPSLLTVELGAFDASYALTVADFKKQLQILINALQGAWLYTAPNVVPSILIIASYQPSPSNTGNYPAAWSQYVAAMQSVANTTQVGFLDLSATMGQADTSGNSYYGYDGLNPNDYGHHKIADLVFKAVTDTTAAYLQGPQTWYRALANRASAPAKWTGIGDSLTEGQGASTLDKTWASIILKTLRANYPVLNVPGGLGYRPGQYNVYSPDSTWTNWYTASSGDFYQNDAGAAPGYRLTYLVQNASRTYPFYGTDIDVWVGNGGGTIRYSIDGGATTDVPTTNDGGVTISSKTGLTRGQHSITITTPSSGGASFNGFMIYDGDRTKGIQYYEGSHSGAKTSLYLSDLPHYLQNMQTIAPALITISLGDNDSATDGVATVMNNVITLAGALSDLPGSPSIVFIAPYFFGNNNSISTQSQYNEGYKIITQAIGGTLLDMSAMVPTTDTSGTGYYSTDGVHLNNTGHAFIAQKFLPTLTDTRLTSAAAGTVLATETWSAANGSSWPSQWAVTAANGGTIDVQNGMGRVITPTTNYSPPGSTYLTGMPAVSDTEILIDFSTPDITKEQYSLVGARIQTPTWNAIGDPTTGYLFNVYPKTGAIEVVYSGPFTSLQQASFTFASGVTYSARWQLIGSRTKVRVWQKGTTEPTTWNIDAGGATDTTPGKVAVFSESGGDGAAQMYYDNLTVIAPLQTGKVYIGNQLRPLGYIGSQPIKAVYIGPNKVQ